MSTARAGLALGVVAALSISVTNVASRLHFEAGSTPATFLLWRYALFAALLGLALAALGKLRRVPRGRRLDLLGAGLLNIGGAGSLAFAIERLPVALAVTVLYLFPFLTLLLDAAVARRAPRPLVLGALGLAFVGLVLALGLGADGAVDPDPVGLLFALCAALGIAASLVWTERRLGVIGDGTRLFWLIVVGLGAALALGLLGGDLVSPFASAERGLSFLAAAVCFAIAMAALFAAIARAGAPTTALLMNLEPPATVLLAALALGERLGATQLLGVALVVAAVVVAQRVGDDGATDAPAAGQASGGAGASQARR